jgi:hypothetical protein
MVITTSAAGLDQDISTADGWTVHYDRFLVHVSSVSVAGADGVIAAPAPVPPQIVDQVAPGSKTLLSAPLRTARAWEVVTFRIGPQADADTESDTTLVAPVTDADKTRMQDGGWSIWVKGTLSKEGSRKSFEWGFSTDTTFGNCADSRNGTVVQGLVVPPHGTDSADIAMAGERLFSDDLSDSAALRGEAIAAADGDGDGTISMDELHALSLDDARSHGGTYGTDTATDITDLGAFVEARTRMLVARFRTAGTCTAEPATSTE